MIIVVGAPVSSADRFTVSGTLIVRDDSGHGVQKVTIRDRFGAEITSQVFECPEFAEVRAEAVERDRLPLRLEALDCQGVSSTPTTSIWTHAVAENETDPSIPLPGNALECSDHPACGAAAAAVTHARNVVLERCSDARATRGRRDAHTAAAVALATAVVALVAAGIAALGVPVVGAVLGAVLLGVAVGLAYFAAVEGLLAFREQQRLDEAEAALAAARRQFTEAADRVGRECTRADCITVDLTQPSC